METIDRERTVAEMATILRVSEVWVRELARRGEIPATKKGHYWYFNSTEVSSARFKANNYKEKI
ncbi:MAG: helix-turn-helix domain-containing protein [Colwellia sp.]|nr:helix-turn-helix domain-containing protein [Colwellia sp.]